MRLWQAVAMGVLYLCSREAGAQTPVPSEPPTKAMPQAFHDKHYGVRFEVPAGWKFEQRDRELSTFRLDARSAAPTSEMRGVAAIDFNPFPTSTFSGALFYFSVQRRTNDRECATQTQGLGEAKHDSRNIGGMNFRHEHDEHGGICVEARDDVYTAYRKGSCYRFDLILHTFCSISSGAQEMSERQMRDIGSRLDTILSSVVLDWKPSHSPVEPEANSNRRAMPPSGTSGTP